ncbi:glycosyltransferase family 4 protein [Paenibacillus wenxiniae]|uniref:Glycosyltransferase family 4 protein n=1 Tax=Paenibacillus wenxiniae TaxID=1636843 RepID=A0ABW4REL6_9BACL
MKDKPKIVFVINYFYPDYASTGQLLTELCLYLQHDFDITVIAECPPGYGGADAGKGRVLRDRLENIEVVRIRLPEVDKQNKLSRIKYISTYFWFATYQLLKEKNTDFIYTISTPPVLGGLIGTIGKLLKRSKHIYNIQDFNPEQAEAVGYTDRKWIFNIARMIDNINCSLSDHVITVGKDMQETLDRRFGGRKQIANTVINNWTNEQEIVPLAKDHPRVAEFVRTHGWENKFVVMYSGNLGLYYDLENLITIVPKLKDCKDLVFAFIGEGAMKSKMQEYAAKHGLIESGQVCFLPFQPKEDLKYSLNAADVHLVVNQKGIKGVSVPSKIYGVMAAGKPIMGVLEEGSEAHRLIVESYCGNVAEPQQYDDVASRIRELYELDAIELQRVGQNGRDYLEKYLRRDVSLEKYRQLLLSMVTPSSSPSMLPESR